MLQGVGPFNQVLQKSVHLTLQFGDYNISTDVRLTIMKKKTSESSLMIRVLVGLVFTKLSTYN